jgi:hypothetical protein
MTRRARACFVVTMAARALMSTWSSIPILLRASPSSIPVCFAFCCCVADHNNKQPPTTCTKITTMRFAAITLSSLLARSALSFSPATTRSTSPSLLRRTFSNGADRGRGSVLRANVPRLSDPERQLLDQVDVFIFDCDGVIWRVRRRVCVGRMKRESTEETTAFHPCSHSQK